MKMKMREFSLTGQLTVYEVSIDLSLCQYIFHGAAFVAGENVHGVISDGIGDLIES